MSFEKAVDTAQWYVIHTKPREEERAENNLRAWKIETLSPKLKERHFNRYTGNPTSLIKPLFPRYIFARFDACKLLHKIYYTRGIHSVVSFGGSPTPVDDEVIRIIKSRIHEDGFVRDADEPKVGDQVVVKTGPFKSFEGIFDCEMKENDRVSILLTTISYQGRILIPKELIEKLVA